MGGVSPSRRDERSWSDPELVLTQHRRVRIITAGAAARQDRCAVCGQRAAASGPGWRVGERSPRLMRGRAPRLFASPGKALIRFELGDLGGHESPGRRSAEKRLPSPESWHSGPELVADALGVGVESDATARGGSTNPR